MPRLTNSEWEDIIDILTTQGLSLIPELAKKYGVTPQSVNRQLRKYGYRRRNKRSDKGEKILPENVYHKLVLLVNTYKRPAEEAIKDLIIDGTIKGEIENGQLIKSPIHPSTLRRWLRDDELGRKSKLKKASLRLTTSYPLEVLQWDSTRATQWYVSHEKNNDSVVKYISPMSENKNRSNKKTKLVFMAFQDMFSRKVWFKVDTHESTQTWLQQFYEVTSKTGLPKYIYTDNASMFHRSGVVNKTLKELNVELLTHIPGNPQAKGMIERSIQFLEKRSSITRIEKITTLKQYNQMVNAIANEYNSRTHSVTDMAPNTLFYSHLQHLTVVMPPDYKSFMSLCPKWDSRLLMPNFTIKWNGKTYQAKTYRNILSNSIGKKVKVEEDIRDRDKINIIAEGKEIKALNIDIYGEDIIPFGAFKQMPESKKDKLKKELESYKNVTTGSYTTRIEMVSGLEKVSKKQYEKPNVVNFNIKRNINQTAHDFESACIYLASNDIKVTTAVELTLENLFGDRNKIYESELNSLIRKVKEADSA